MNVLIIKNNEFPASGWGRSCGGKPSCKNENSPTFNFFQGPQLASFKNNSEPLDSRKDHAPKLTSLHTWGSLGEKTKGVPRL